MIGIHDIKLRYKTSLNLSDCHHTLYKDDELGITSEVVTSKTHSGFAIGKPNRSYYIDKDEREFLTLEDLVTAYNEKFKFEGENPEHEITYIKVIKKRIT